MGYGTGCVLVTKQVNSNEPADHHRPYNIEHTADISRVPDQGPYAPQGSRRLRKWSRRSKSVLPTF